MDLGHLLISIFRGGLIRPLLTDKLWHCRQTLFRSLKKSLKHFVQYLENAARMVRALCGLTTVLWALSMALDSEMAGPTKLKEQQRKMAKAVKVAKLIEDWVGADIHTELVMLFLVQIQSVKTLPIDPLGLRNVQLEVS